MIAGCIAIGGGLYYYFSDQEHAAKAKSELHHIEHKAEDVYGAAKSKLAGARDSAEHSVDKLKVDTRTWAEKAKDEVTSQKNLAGSKADPALGKALAKGQEVVNDGKSWFSSGTSKVDQAEADAKAKLESARVKAEQVKEDAKATVRYLCPRNALEPCSLFCCRARAGGAGVDRRSMTPSLKPSLRRGSSSPRASR